MNKGHVKVKNVLIYLALIVLMSGCTSMQPMSSYARTGDTVMIAIGGSKQHVTIPVLTKDDVAITVTDSAGNIYPVKVRHVFRVYPDPTSYYRHSVWEVDNSEGEWLAILDLVDPQTDASLPLSIGQGYLSISSAHVQNFNLYGWQYASGDINNIPIEILDGQGAPNELNNMRFFSENAISNIEPLPQIQVSPSRGVLEGENIILAGGEFLFRVDKSYFQNLNSINVTTTTGDAYNQVMVKYIPQDEIEGFIKVVVMNPNGFMPSDHAGKTGLSSPYKSLSLSLFWFSNGAITNDTWQQAIQLVSGKYVDIAGNPVLDITPVMNKIR